MTLDRNKIYAFIADGDNDGIVGVAIAGPGGVPMMLPLVSLGDEKKLAQMRQMATEVAQMSGKIIRLYEFTVPKELAVITPATGSVH